MDISIIMPVYNVEKYIEKSIKSVIQQKKSQLKYEIIIVNDGTQDDSIKIAEGLLSKSGINYDIINQENSGVSVARNNGLQHAKGDYVLFLDSDDILSSDFIYTLSNETTKENDIIFWAFSEIDMSGKILREYSEVYQTQNRIYKSGIDVLRAILIEKNHLIWTGSAIYSRLFLIENGLLFNKNHINGEDQEFILSSLAIAKKVSFISHTLSYYLIRENSISTSFKLRKFDSVIALENVRNNIIKRYGSDNELINAINSYIVENFLYVYKSGLAVNSSKEMIAVLNSLDNYYPYLTTIIKEKMVIYNNNNLIKRIEVMIAKRFILIYGIVYRLHRKIRLGGGLNG